ncbi:MAG TPA: hypothetical protein VK629_11645 [Steroidobacteraceae bacterium]|nr:hypothetical protein [Steroidobacteraceae bacterium]
MGGLFAIAWWGDRSRFYPNHTPLLLLAPSLGFFVEKLVRLAKRQNATSISDFLSARFGRSRRIGVLVTVITLTGERSLTLSKRT